MLLVANWKMHGDRLMCDALCQAFRKATWPADLKVVICPPSLYIPQCAQALQGSDLAWGAQNVHDVASGAYTGEVSAPMLVDWGCTHVIIGHSERRAGFAEDDAWVVQKCLAAWSVGLTPIVCVGESAKARDEGATAAVIQGQIEPLMPHLSKDNPLVIAYEPIWAIGTGQAATPEQAQSVHALIRSELTQIDEAFAKSTPILYGGSVKVANAASLFAMPDIDGALVGGASLDAESFIQIGALCKA